MIFIRKIKFYYRILKKIRLCFWLGGLNIIWMLVVFKLIYSLNVILIKFLVGFFIEFNRLIINIYG